MSSVLPATPRVAKDQQPKFHRPVTNHADGNAKFAVVQVVSSQPPKELAKDYPRGKKVITTFPAYGIAMHFASKCKEFAAYDDAKFIVVPAAKARTLTR